MNTTRHPAQIFVKDLQESDTRTLQGTRATLLDRLALNFLYDAIGRPPVDFKLWDGTHAANSPGGSRLRIIFRTRKALWRTCLRPDPGFGDAYTVGEADIEGDLIETLIETYRTMEQSPWQNFRRRVPGWVALPYGNSLTESKRNIAAHYDLGNDFYRLWLDPDMVYTCAYYRGADLDLAAAQQAKLEHVCRKVGLTPGMRVVEAGCGWGSLALYMARHYGVKVRAFNISREQIAHAQQRAREEGLDHAVEFIEDDYRNIRGEYDAFVSVGMLEHVGPDHYRELGELVKRCLAPAGRGLIHSVGRNRTTPMNGWIHQRIFPGSYTPSLKEMMDIFEETSFSIIDVENLRLHYARTLTDWLRNFDDRLPVIRDKYNEAFIRAWRLYLGGCVAAFTAGTLQLFQVVFTHSGNNRLPRSRDHLYAGTEPEFWSN
jgi:cyclopropane-fatty-acyl-phospholipid synthase